MCRGWRRMKNLEEKAAALLLFLLGQESGARGVFKDLTHTLVRLGRTFKVLVRVDLLRHFFTLDSGS